METLGLSPRPVDFLPPTGPFAARPVVFQTTGADPCAALGDHHDHFAEVLTVDPANQGRLLGMLRENVDQVIHTLDGWISTTLIASTDGTRVVIHSQWRDAAAIASMRRSKA